MPIRTGHPQNAGASYRRIAAPEVWSLSRCGRLFPATKRFCHSFGCRCTIVTCWIPISLLMMNW
ncbi:hypothetical protein ACLK1T_17490 [Escherichia coli]